MLTSPERRTSEVLRDIIDLEGVPTLSIGQLMERLGERAFALAILIFALPNSLPIPGIPGFSTITGLPILFIALQMVWGRPTIWLPKKVAAREFSHDTLARLLSKALPAVMWIEKFLRPRLVWVCDTKCERLVGALFVVLALIIALPMPGGNFLPGLSMSLIALGLLERDGGFVLAAAAFGIASIIAMYKLIVGVIVWFIGLF